VYARALSPLDLARKTVEHVPLKSRGIPAAAAHVVRTKAIGHTSRLRHQPAVTTIGEDLYVVQRRDQAPSAVTPIPHPTAGEEKARMRRLVETTAQFTAGLVSDASVEAAIADHEASVRDLQNTRAEVTLRDAAFIWSEGF